MPITEMTPKECLEYAIRVARMMGKGKDPELESLAGMCALRAIRSFDPKHNVPEKRWIARIVRVRIWDYWRKMAKLREENFSEVWWEKSVYIFPEKLYDELGPVDFKLLYEYYVEKWCLDVVARRADITEYEAKKRIRAAVARLKEACE